MGKKGKKVDPLKKAALAAKKEAKADKKAQKREQKQATKNAVAATASSVSGTASQEGNNKSKKQQQQQAEQQQQRQEDSSSAAYLDALLLKYRQQDAAVTTGNSGTAVLERLDGFPPPRANATFTLYEGNKSNNHAYLFGGEYYDGIEHLVLNQLLRYDLIKREWKLVDTGGCGKIPPPRCAHSTVYYNHALYVFGGETIRGAASASADHGGYVHYRDLWKFHLKELYWQQIGAGGGSNKKNKHNHHWPSSRSGHACAVWKHYMIVFGGFHEGKDVQQWYNDVAVFDLQTEQWLPLPTPSKLNTNRPEPRSACNAAVLGDDLYVQGGFSKLFLQKNPPTPPAKGIGTMSNSSSGGAVSDPAQQLPLQETCVYTDAWKLCLKPLLQGKPPTWERVMRSTNIGTSTAAPKQQQQQMQLQQGQHKGAACSVSATARLACDPCGRAGTSSCSYKEQSMLIFGGVMDREHHHHVMESVFFNNLFGLNVSKRKWFSIHTQSTLSTATTASSKDKKQQQQEEAPPPKSDQVGEQQGDKDDLEDQENDDNVNQENAIWDLDRLRWKMSAFKDGQGNTIYEKIQASPSPLRANNNDDDEEEEEEEKEEEKDGDETTDEPLEEKQNDDDNDNDQSLKRSSQQLSAPQPPTVADERPLSPPTEPLPRIHANLILSGHVLYVYGGLVEVGDREVTLDDLWSLDLRNPKQRQRGGGGGGGWQCIFPGTMHEQVWRGVSLQDGDDDSYCSSSNAAGNAGSSHNDDEDEEDSEEEEEEKEQDHGDESRNKKKEQLAELYQQYNIHDNTLLPRVGEALADFYARTKSYWNQQAQTEVEVEAEAAAEPINDDNDNDEATSGKEQIGSSTVSAKELKRRGFGMAKSHFQQLEPVLNRIHALRLHDVDDDQEK